MVTVLLQSQIEAAPIARVTPVRYSQMRLNKWSEDISPDIRQHRKELEEMPHLMQQEKQIKHTLWKKRLEDQVDSSSEFYEKEMYSPKIPWNNPCDGTYFDTTNYIESKSRIEILKDLKQHLNNEFQTMRSGNTSINISDMKNWSKYRPLYRFLPKQSEKKLPIQLIAWHRDMQVYVGAFDSLRLTQLYYDYNKTFKESRVYKELEQLTNHARSILCEIETAINATTKNRKKNIQIKTMRLNVMQKRLKFVTNSSHIFGFKKNIQRAPLPKGRELIPNNQLDLKFLKNAFFVYTKKSLRNLRLFLSKNNNSSGKDSKQNTRSNKKKT